MFKDVMAASLTTSWLTIYIIALNIFAYVHEQTEEKENA